MTRIKNTLKCIWSAYKEAGVYNRMYYHALTQDYGLAKEELRFRKEK